MEMVHEEWRPVVGKFAGWNYEVSNLGRVRSTSTYRPHLYHRILSQHMGNAGYLIKVLCHENKSVNINIHILVAEALRNSDWAEDCPVWPASSVARFKESRREAH